jgi:hypothetical protein
MVLCLGQIQNPDKGIRASSGNMLNITLPGFSAIVVYQDHYGGQYSKENSLPCNDAMKI